MGANKGRPADIDPRVAVAIRLPAEIRDVLERAAKREYRSTSNFVEMAVYEALKARGLIGPEDGQ